MRDPLPPFCIDENAPTDTNLLQGWLVQQWNRINGQHAGGLEGGSTVIARYTYIKRASNRRCHCRIREAKNRFAMHAMAFLLEFHSEAGHEQLSFETPQSFAEPDFLTRWCAGACARSPQICPCQIVMPCLRPNMCIFLFFCLNPGQERMIFKGIATSRSSLPWLCCSLDQILRHTQKIFRSVV